MKLKREPQIPKRLRSREVLVVEEEQEDGRPEAFIQKQKDRLFLEMRDAAIQDSEEGLKIERDFYILFHDAWVQLRTRRHPGAYDYAIDRCLPVQLERFPEYREEMRNKLSSKLSVEVEWLLERLDEVPRKQWMSTAGNLRRVLKDSLTKLFLYPEQKEKIREQIKNYVTTEFFEREDEGMIYNFDYVVNLVLLFPEYRPQAQAWIRKNWNFVEEEWNSIEKPEKKTECLANLEIIFAQDAQVSQDSRLVVTAGQKKLKHTPGLPERLIT